MSRVLRSCHSPSILASVALLAGLAALPAMAGSGDHGGVDEATLRKVYDRPNYSPYPIGRAHV